MLSDSILHVEKYKQEHNISSEFGFLSPAPLVKFPLDDPILTEYDSFCSILQKHIISGKFRYRVLKLPQIDVKTLDSNPKLERVMLLLCLIAHAYLHGNALLGETPLDVLPKNIAIPWWEVSQKLGRSPALSHASIVLNNWMYLDKEDKTFSLNNVGTINGSLQGIDEDWFYLIAIDIEYRAISGINALLDLIKSINAQQMDSLESHLSIIKSSLMEMTSTLSKMPIHNSPFIFYNRVRTYVAAWEKGSEKFPKGVIYEGVSEEPKYFLGGTAAQSSTLHIFDELFQIKHKSPLLKEMREYMPKEHREFINDVAEWSKDAKLIKIIKEQKKDKLNQLFNDCIDEIVAFRTKHIQLVASFIVNQSKDVDKEKGTGGSSLIPWLKQIREEAEEKKIKYE